MSEQADIPGYYPENATGTEYEKYLENLWLFSEENPEEIRDISQLEAHVGRLIRPLAGVIQNNYTLDERRDEQGKVYDRGFSLRAPIENDSFFAMIGDMPDLMEPDRSTNANNIVLSRSSSQGEVYEIDIPTDKRLVNTYGLLLTASERTPDGEITTFTPANGDARMVQGYVGVLHRGIKDLLTVARRPTKIPPELEGQFK